MPLDWVYVWILKIQYQILKIHTYSHILDLTVRVFHQYGKCNERCDQNRGRLGKQRGMCVCVSVLGGIKEEFLLRYFLERSYKIRESCLYPSWYYGVHPITSSHYYNPCFHNQPELIVVVRHELYKQPIPHLTSGRCVTSLFCG